MDPEIEAVLVQRLSDLGREAGRIGGGAAGARGGAHGAAWSARRLRTETAVHAEDVDPAQVPAVVAALTRALHAEPEAVQAPSGGAVVVRGTVGSGAAGLNPAYVVAVVETDTGRVGVAAHAKEGLIRQRTAEKAVRQVVAALRDG